MKNTLIVIFLLQFLWIANGCKKKEEGKPYEPVKQKFTDIPGTDCYIANTDTAFIDTGLVIVVKGKGFDPSFKRHYTLSNNIYSVAYGDGELSVEPKLVSIDASTIVFKYSKNYFELDDCRYPLISFTFIKYSDDIVADVNYAKRYLAASSPKYLTYKNYYKITKDTVLLQKPKIARSDFFIEQYGFPSCYIDMVVGNKTFILTGKNNTRIVNKEDNFYQIGIPLDSNYNISDGYYQVKLLKDGKELYRTGERSGVYVKNVK